METHACDPTEDVRSEVLPPKTSHEIQNDSIERRKDDIGREVAENESDNPRSRAEVVERVSVDLRPRFEQLTHKGCRLVLDQR